MGAIAEWIRVLILGLFAVSASTQDAPAPLGKLTEDEIQVARICDQMQSSLREFFQACDAIEDEEKRDAFRRERDPTSSFIDQLIDFEATNRGMPSGLMATRRLVFLGVNAVSPEDPCQRARSVALKALPSYADNELLPEILRYLNAGNPEMLTEACLREIISRTTSESNRLFAQYMLGRWILEMRDLSDFVETRLDAIGTGEPLQSPEEKQRLLDYASRLPKDRIRELEREAMNLLSSVAHSESNCRQPAVVRGDGSGHILRLDNKNVESMPRISDLAAGVLFVENHLRVGKHAPELKVRLIDQKEWTLHDHRGKIVVIQFSFKGCGPCEAMYPDLRDLVDQYGDKLSVLSIMADANPEVTAQALEDGKITWDVTWDGDGGPIATLWAVQAFPTVYIIAPDGTVAAADLSGIALRDKVKQLAQP
jgi:thiol-disulfide isomerase/thioredoxin